MGLVDGVGVDQMYAPVRTCIVLRTHYHPIQSVQSPISLHPLLVSSYKHKSTTTIVELISVSLEETPVHQHILNNFSISCCKTTENPLV